jgi:hypothetical protein
MAEGEAMSEIRALYERLQELEMDELHRGHALDVSDGRPHHIGIQNPEHTTVEVSVDGRVVFTASDRYGVCLTIALTAAQAIELGWNDPEGFWHREWQRVVLRGATQRDRDAVYKGITGSKESSFWNALERAWGGDPVAAVTNREVLKP